VITVKKIKGIIFDLDGVLVHTDELHYRAWKKVADQLDIPFNREVNNRLRGVSRMESLEIVLENSNNTFTEEKKVKLASEKNELYRIYLEDLTPNDVQKEVRELLHSLKNKGYKLAIGSSSKNAGMILQKTNLNDMFDALSDGNNISNSKPHPEVFFKAAEFLLLPPEKCAVVEDARAGVDAAIAGGFICFAMGDAANYELAHHSLNTLPELMNYL